MDWLTTKALQTVFSTAVYALYNFFQILGKQHNYFFQFCLTALMPWAAESIMTIMIRNTTKIYDGEMSSKTFLTTLLQIFYKIILNFLEELLSINR